MLGERQAGCRDAFAIFRLKDLCSKEELHFDPMQTISREKWLVFEWSQGEKKLFPNLKFPHASCCWSFWSVGNVVEYKESKKFLVSNSGFSRIELAWCLGNWRPRWSLTLSVNVSSLVPGWASLLISMYLTLSSMFLWCVHPPWLECPCTVHK